MAYNNFTTFGEILRLRDKVMNENDVFNVGKGKLARIFLIELLDLDTSASDGEIESVYKACSHYKEIPDDPRMFWHFVEKQYLHLEVEPVTKFAEISLRVNKDLLSISENLSYIKKELQSLERKKKNEGRLTADERYYRNQLEYFEKKNILARDEIIDFMTHGIKRHAIAKASVQHTTVLALGATLFGDSPYAFGRRFHWVPTDPYDVNSLNMYSNKFMDLPVSHYHWLVKECKSSPEKFKENANAYINGTIEDLPSVRERLADLVKNSHILSSRKQVIETMLRHFEDKDYLSFVSMASLQIEGIFSDICRGIGVSENQLDISSLNDKLQHIDERMRSFFCYEYYSFKFPVLRNLVAHGGLVDGELEDTAIHLMLDLLPVCELTVSKDLPIMHALDVLEQAGKGKSEKLVEWLDLCNSVTIPDFYAVQEKITKTEAHYTSQDFWNHLEDELKKLKDVNQVKNCKPVKAAGKLKSMGIATDQAKNFLESSKQIADEAIKQRNARLEMFNKPYKSKIFSNIDNISTQNMEDNFQLIMSDPELK